MKNKNNKKIIFLLFLFKEIKKNDELFLKIFNIKKEEIEQLIKDEMISLNKNKKDYIFYKEGREKEKFFYKNIEISTKKIFSELFDELNILIKLKDFINKILINKNNNFYIKNLFEKTFKNWNEEFFKNKNKFDFFFNKIIFKEILIQNNLSFQEYFLFFKNTKKIILNLMNLKLNNKELTEEVKKKIENNFFCSLSFNFFWLKEF